MASDRLREFLVFKLIVEAGSFSAAARKLGCTPSAVSKLVDRLESRLGARLIQRTSRALLVTQEGKSFQQAATRVLEAMESADALLANIAAPASGTLRVHTTLNFAEHQLAPALAEFLERYPRIKLEFVLTSDPLDLIDEEIDISIQVGPIADMSLVAKRIGTTRWLICGSPAYLRRHGTPLSPDELSRHNCLNFFAQSYRSVWPMRLPEGAPVPEINGSIVSNSDNFLRVLARRGLGLVRLSDFHVEQDVREGRLVPVLQAFQLDAPEPIFAVFQSRRHLSSRARVFLRFLEHRLAQTLHLSTTA